MYEFKRDADTRLLFTAKPKTASTHSARRDSETASF
jgi:hypothetical protein